MGLFGTTRIRCPAKQWTCIIRNSFVQIPVSFQVQLKTESGNPVAGSFTETASKWIFPGTPRTGPLADQLRFDRGWFNTFYSVQVCPTEDCVAEVD